MSPRGAAAADGAAGRRPPVPGAWVRSDLARPHPVDLAVLDVDGVLLDVEPSFRECVRVTTGRVQALLGVRRPWMPSREDIRRLKRAGGFNDDVDVTVAVTAIGVAGRGAELTVLAADVAAAGGGLDGLRAAVADLPDVSRALVVRVFDEHYWGAAAFRRRFGAVAEHGPTAEGLRERERVLVARDLPERLRAAGAGHLALVTGRTPFELEDALARLGWARADLAAVVTSEVALKPDPTCLDAVVGATGARSLVYAGDVRDDWDLVRRYRAERVDGARALGVVVGVEARALRSLGCDATLRSADDLPALLDWLRAPVRPPAGRPPVRRGRGSS